MKHSAGTSIAVALRDDGERLRLIMAVDEHQPEVAVIDVRMPPDYGHEGAEAALALRARHPDLGIMLLFQTIEVARPAARGQRSPPGPRRAHLAARPQAVISLRLSLGHERSISDNVKHIDYVDRY